MSYKEQSKMHPVEHVAISLAAVLGFSTFPWAVDAHSWGLHGISGAQPSGDPNLPEIQGAFEVEVKVRFNDVASNNFNHLFEYSDDSFANEVFFAQYTSATVETSLFRVVVDGGTPFDCSYNLATPLLVEGQVYSYKFGVDQSNVASIFHDGQLLTECTNAPIPLNMTRNHFLRTGTYDGRFGNVIPLEGAILGLRVTNLDVGPQHPHEAFAHRNIPSQVFDSPFVASFYARFDRFNLLLNYQRVFDFGNGEQDNNIVCGQYIFGTDFMCEVWVGNVRYRLIAPGAIDAGQFSFWHFGMEANGTLWIDKDGTTVAETQFPGLITEKVFRSSMLFGDSHFGGDAPLYGVVLGFRLDRAIVS